MQQRLDVERIVTTTGVIAPASVLLDGDRIVAVGTPGQVGTTSTEVSALRGTLVPGFVDVQINGTGGFQYGMASDALAATAPSLLAAGVTAHCPTITTRAWDRYPAAVASLGVTTGPAPRNLGIHLEGPFLSSDAAGAHDREQLRNATPDAIDEYLAFAPGGIAIVTLAPELPGADEAIAALVAAGIVVSAGHTDASYDNLRRAADHGVTMVTHVFNAQRGFGHRDPGTAGGALLIDGLFVGIILDGHHVHPDLAAMVLQLCGPRAIAVTDAIATAGLPLGRHEFDGIVVDTSSGAPRLGDGTLAGSNITMDAAFRFVAAARGLEAAVSATATAPARSLGRHDLGVIAPDALADLTLLDDDHRVTGVWRDGARVVG